MLSSARRRALAVAVASGAAVAAQLVATPVASASVNPAQVCVQLGDLGLSRGACASSVAKSRTSDPDQVVPSRAAYIANCKELEKTMFVAPGPDGRVPSRPYPYQFYKGVLDDPQAVAGFFQVPLEVAEQIAATYRAKASAFTADNRAGCVQVLQGLHTGELFRMLLPAAP